jgi:MFS transporter, DHA3 family, tetracycline resistance protein
MNRKVSQRTIYLIYTGATAFLFSLVFTVNQIYRIDMLKLNPLQLVLVGTVLEASAFIFEIPTGIVADMRSRKLSVIIGVALTGAAFMLEGSIPMFSAVILSQILWGIGYTFTSGADEAWIADEVGEKELDSVYLRGAQVAQMFSLAGIGLSTIIGAKMINLPIIAGGALFMLLAVFLIYFMRESNFTPTSAEERNSWQQMGHTFVEGMKFIKGKRVLMVILAMSLLYGLYSEGFDRLWTAHFLSNIKFPGEFDVKPVVWIGIINGFAMILSIAAVEHIKRVMDKTGKLQNIWILTVINVFMVITIILFGLAGNFAMGLSTYMAFYMLRTINGPIFNSWRNKNIKSEVRATVLSTYGQMDALGQVIGGPIIGFIALRASIPTAIIVSGIILSPIVILLIVGRRDRYSVPFVDKGTEG